MYKVILVDDEPWILRGLNKTFRWEQHGFMVTAEETNSVTALKKIIDEKPDVVFTDIRMPELDGIELMDKVRQHGLECEFIVISGFAEFSYAQQAMRQGALDYLLKPIEYEVAEELLIKLGKQLSGKKRLKAIQLFELLVNNDDNVCHILQRIGLAADNEYYQMAVITAEPERMAALENILDSMDNSELLVIGKGKLLLLANTSTDISDLVELRLSDSGLLEHVSVGISRLNKGFTNFHRLYKEADMAVSLSFVYGAGRIYAYSSHSNQSFQDMTEELSLLIRSKRMKEAGDYIENYIESFVQDGVSINQVVLFWNRINDLLGSCGYADASDNHMEYDELVLRFESFTEMCLYIRSVISSADQLNYSNDMNSKFKELLEYVKLNYNENLLLKDLAAKFYINFTYCCDLFKKYTGGTFSEYLTSIRIGKARDLLLNSSLSIDEISSIVGYSDYYYFIKVFKKFYKITPNKLRSTKEG